MKILLLSPVQNSEARTPRAIRIPEISLNLIKALTPDKDEVRIVQEETEDIDLEADCDLVGISCMTSNAPRAYELAGEFRRRGRKVVLGGIHPSVLPDEACRHADAVVVGEAENVWATVLDDAGRGALKKKYWGPPSDLARFPVIRLAESQQNDFMNIAPVMTTKGCPYSCEFCCVSAVYGRTLRHIPIPVVIDYIRSSGRKIFLFLDDNLIGHKAYAKELFRRLIPLNIRWVGQSSISFADDTELMQLAARSGCYALFVGLESVVPETLSTMIKTRPPKASSEAIARIRDAGIAFHASVVFGFDADGEGVFDSTLEFLLKARVHSVSFNILTPYPGTALYARLEQQGRLLTRDWRQYDHTRVVFKPKKMTAEFLAENYLRVRREFYSVTGILRRLPNNRAHPLVYLGINGGLRSSVRRDVRAFERSVAVRARPGVEALRTAEEP